MSGLIFFFKQKTAYEMRISDWSSDVCSSDLQRTLNSVGSRLLHDCGFDPGDVVTARQFHRTSDGGGIGGALHHLVTRVPDADVDAHGDEAGQRGQDRKSTRLNSSH